MTAYHYGIAGYPSHSDSAAFGGGDVFFAGGVDAGVARARQAWLLLGHWQALQEARLKVRLSAWLAGNADGLDRARVNLRFLSVDGEFLGFRKTAVVSGTGDAFQEVAVSAILPPATYKIQVLLVAKRLGGANNDASFDKLDLRIHRLDRARNDRP